MIVKLEKPSKQNALLHLVAIHLEAILHRPLWLLITRSGSGLAKDQLALQRPGLRDFPFVGNERSDRRLVMLKVASQALGFKSSPYCSRINKLT
jgi:hypothetical protein